MLFKTAVKQTIDEEKKIPLKFDITMMNMFIGYLFKRSVQINRKSLNNMKRLFDVIDESIYDNNEQMEQRFKFITKALEARIDKGFENDDAIINYCRTDVFNKENEEIIENIPKYTRINFEEIKYINKAIQDRLQYYYLFKYKDLIYETVEKLDSGEYNSFSEINSELVNICADVINRVRKSKSVENSDTFSLDDENFENNVIDIVTKLKNPSRLLKTGIQKLNQILAPALRGGRLYIFMGLPGGFKSGILLKILRDIRKYNSGIQVKKPGKRPCVLMVTMENSVNKIGGLV